MHARNIAVAQAAAAHGIEIDIRILTEATPTAKAAADHLGIEVGQIANSLIFDADGRAILVMTSGAHRVDTVFLAEQIGAEEITRATPDQVRGATGQVIGGVAPCGHPSPVETYLDRSLGAFDEIWAAGGTAESMFALTFDQLSTLTNGTIVDVTRD